MNFPFYFGVKYDLGIFPLDSTSHICDKLKYHSGRTDRAITGASFESDLFF